MATPGPPSFGALLRRYRKAAGWTQEELAAQANMSAHGIADLEAGRRRTPRKETVALLVNALGLAGQDRSLFEAMARQRSVTAPTIMTAGSGVNPDVRLVGREAEVALIERHLAGIGPPLLVVAGEPGIGKSRLLREAMTRAGALGWEVLSGGCHRRSGQEPFAPLLTALERHLSQQSPTHQRQHLQGCGWLVRLLPELTETGVVTSPIASLPPEQERRLMFAAASRYLANIAGSAGTLLVLDDLHWAAPDALDLLGALLRTPTSAPFRILAAYRDTEMRKRDALPLLIADLAHEDLATHTTLEPLSMAEAMDLLDDLLLDTPASHTDLRQQLIVRAGGVPYFLLSCAQAMDAGEPSTPVAIPWSVAETIRQRVSALGDAAQEVLGVAAVIGREVSRALLVGVGMRLGMAESAILAHGDEACQRRLLTEMTPQTYAFAHDLVREVIAGDLTTTHRTQVHRIVAAVLEESVGKVPVEQLAYHYRHSGDLDKAVSYIVQAGDRAARVYAHAEAIRYYQEAVEVFSVLGQETEVAHAREELAEEFLRSARYDEAITLLNPAIEMYRTEGDVAGVIRATSQLGRVYARRGPPQEGVARLEPVLAWCRATNANQGLAPLYNALAALYEAQGRSGDTLSMAEHAYDQAQATGDTRSMVIALVQKGSALRDMDRVAEGLQVLNEEVIPLAELAGDSDVLAHALYNVSCVYYLLGNLEQRQRYLERTLPLAERLGDPTFTLNVFYELGECEILVGAWQQARTHFERAIEISRTIEVSLVLANPFFGLGALLLFMGDERGLAYLQEALRLASQSQNHGIERATHTILAERDLVEGRPAAAYAHVAAVIEESDPTLATTFYSFPVLAWAYLENGELARAQELLRQTITRSRERHLLTILADALRIQAMLATKQHQWSDAEQALEEGLALCKQIAFRNEEAQVRYAYGLYHLRRGEPQQAHQHLTAALAICQQLGERLYARQIEHALAKCTHECY